MPNGSGLLNVKLDLKRWMDMDEAERKERTFWRINGS